MTSLSGGALISKCPDGTARIFFPNSYVVVRVRTHLSSVELHLDPGPLKDALPTELPRRGIQSWWRHLAGTDCTQSTFSFLFCVLKSSLSSERKIPAGSSDWRDSPQLRLEARFDPSVSRNRKKRLKLFWKWLLKKLLFVCGHRPTTKELLGLLFLLLSFTIWSISSLKEI